MNRETLSAGAPAPGVESRAVAVAQQPGESNQFDWPLAFEAEQFLRRRIARFLEINSFARQLSGRMSEETGTDFFEWIDHLTLLPEDEHELRQAGFTVEPTSGGNGERVFVHPRATMPRVLLRGISKSSPSVIALRPEFVAEFVAAQNLSAE